ncbi:acyl-CoA thioesterase [Marinomonas mediterranea]|jgi:Acyl-CoA thioesterase|uniref:Acyl-CoA thioesterase 2 n=1 Tax=Marinomonas mediterranea (strain ATCC 700492 / JCM 21426 / NBRC 103028 / MMB-1) TaxID=717774 RepID=F2JUQ0_MARM1|nr:acyl-CoA thioesterase II [Marinomonas mediterranea]ADZ90465.1 Choloyl-CoA hydrolase [Marinomonas mediterranea MMB-1]WCN08520.1 acyl-CoA thioesterase II [Marinomonas mediterranea]WCN12574.1 acyl-CoA thioesterase II [Marinomonas mediterranea]WCN16645.1 acyl-CoA thioesterase II [Marinomonas mediterranea MMB-1]
MNPVLSGLIDLLSLEKRSDDQFVGMSQDLGFPKVFGGQVIGQALSAASQTVEGRVPHSLHCYFIRPGDAAQPIEYEVERVRDGRSFSVRRIIASQLGKTILVMTASFHIEENGLEHQDAMPQVPGPENFKSELSLYRLHAEEIPSKIRGLLTADRPIEYRIVENQNPFRPRAGIGKRHIWMRSIDALPDDPFIHQSMLAYTTDYGFLETALQPHGISIGNPQLNIASLDHSIWFHRPFRLDDWLLYVADSPSASASRGFVRGQIYNRDGVLIASTAQEGLLRKSELYDLT